MRRLLSSFDEAAFGGKKVIRLQSSNGGVQNYEVNIPAGIESGKSIRLKGKGYPGVGGGEAGDLLLKVNVQDKPGYKREGRDVYTTVNIHLQQQYLAVRRRFTPFTVMFSVTLNQVLSPERRYV